MIKKSDNLEKSYPPLRINDATIDNILKHPKFYRGHVRTSIGKIYKTGEFEKRSDEILGKELP